MKSLIFILCCFAAVVQGQNWEKIPGCEKSESVKDLKPEDCCTSYPKSLFPADVWKKCNTTCFSNRSMCCHLDCAIKIFNLVDDSGMFDPHRAERVLRSSVNNDDRWPMEKIISECLKSASEKFKEWQSKQSNSTTCQNFENIFIVKCFRRNLILDCPLWSEAENCKMIMSFTKSCPAYPLLKEKSGTEKSDNNKEENDFFSH